MKGFFVFALNSLLLISSCIEDFPTTPLKEIATLKTDESSSDSRDGNKQNDDLPPRIFEATTTSLAYDATEDTPLTIILEYRDSLNQRADGCHISQLKNLHLLTSCRCDQTGDCSVELVGDSNYAGMVTLEYSVISQDQTSDSALLQFHLANIDDSPVSKNTSLPDVL